MQKNRSKRYRAAAEQVDRSKTYSFSDAVSVLKKLPPTKFDQTVTMSFRLGVDPKQSDQMVRGTVPLPHGSGKVVRVLVFAKSGDLWIRDLATLDERRVTDEQRRQRGIADPVVVVVDTRPGGLEDACIPATAWREIPGTVDFATLRSGGIGAAGKFVSLIVVVDEPDA
jgi:hypothetical protein